jgi:dipeptidyl aminopeptidase/acylaminoacyl peptidase
MTFESRARAGVLDIRRAVEVMEMSTLTDPKANNVERFDRFRDRKQRNRRIGAILVAGVLGVATIVVVSTNMLGDEEPVPAASVPEGRILYEVYAGGNQGVSALHVVEAAGGPSLDLGLDTDPHSVWWPDGTRILVTSTAGPVETATPVRPATVAADGSDFRLLDGVEDRSLNIGCTAFSPDGGRLACTGYTDFEGGVYTVRASDGGGLRALARFQGLPGDFSPAGDEIVFTGDDSRGALGDEPSTLYVIGSDGSGLREITPPGAVLAFSYASWSPDGEWIVFVNADRGLSLVHPDGTGLREIALDAEASIAEVTTVTWSPDGGWIAMSAKTVGGDAVPDIYVTRPDGSEVRQVTDTPEDAEYSPDWIS